MPLYEYRCDSCGRRCTSLLPSWSSDDPPCPVCRASSLRRLVSTFASPRPESGGEGFEESADDETGTSDGWGDDDPGGNSFDDY